MPVRLTVCGLPAALSARLKVAASAPMIVGVNVMLTEHELAGVTVAPLQPFETIAKSAALVPESVIEPTVKVRLAPPLLRTLTV